MPRKKTCGNERGSIDITPSDETIAAGTVLTAAVTDPDGVENVSYSWRVRGDDSRWIRIDDERDATLDIGEWAGREVRVIARYVDDDGNRERHSETFQIPPTDEKSEAPVTGGADGSSDSAASPPTVENAGPAEPDGTSTTPDPIAEAPATGGSADGGGMTEEPVEDVASPAAPENDSAGNPPADDFKIGINLAGAEFGNNPRGTFGVDYTYPTTENIDYYADQGLDSIRVPFKWERLQPTDNGPLDPAELARLDAVVEHASSRGLEVILDVHNYGFRDGSLIGSAETPNSEFADFWGKLAGHYKDDPNVVFGLMNEPYEQSAEEWVDSANAAIAAIRDAGATQKIAVPGTYFDGAWSWVSSDNDTVVGGGIRDPLNNYRFEVHQYLDTDSSGTSPDVVSEDIGVERLVEITEWAEQNGHTLHLGEFGVSDDPEALAAMDKMLAYMQEHSDVWEGGTYWAGGPWWGDYMYSAEPENGVEKPQMEVLTQYA
jgi:endoglucanase